MGWKEQIVKTYAAVPKTFSEAAWRVVVLSVAIMSTLTGIVVWKNPRPGVGKAEGAEESRRTFVVRLKSQNGDIRTHGIAFSTETSLMG